MSIEILVNIFMAIMCAGSIVFWVLVISYEMHFSKRRKRREKKIEKIVNEIEFLRDNILTYDMRRDNE
ncbi:hypothetical protein UFOVP1361_34 [uncultured Caudovirales phage]|uniref:Uncharacterized protein n=1 Tax=uncultured Caudovirales phage TaxID=2100421 RepID=A0A6J5S1S4_9CAUD|nr:hypothetical protein UFOVP1361_34 [uncultured Caudovirales phage]